MAEPIEIIVRRGQSADGTAPENQETPADKKKEQGKPNIQQKAMNAALINAGKQSIMQGIKMQGRLTGDYTMVNKIDNMMSLTADILTIKVGGPVGIIAVAAKHTFSIANTIVDREIINRDYNYMMARTGNIALKGSRYTDD